MERLLDALRTRPLLLDAAMGTRLVAVGLDLSRDDPSLWSIDRPDRVLEVHKADVSAGCDVLTTNTFGANAVRLGALGREREVTAANRTAVKLAREAGQGRCYVLGDIGPAGARAERTLRIQADALLEANVDALLLETFEFPAACQALDWLRGEPSVPVFVSLWSGAAPRDPQTPAHLRDRGAAVVGVNCGSLDETVDVLRTWRASSPGLLARPAGAHPAWPNTLSAQELTRGAIELVAAGARLLGGCCGTTEAHVRALRRAFPAGSVFSIPPGIVTDAVQQSTTL